MDFLTSNQKRSIHLDHSYSKETSNPLDVRLDHNYARKAGVDNNTAMELSESDEGEGVTNTDQTESGEELCRRVGMDDLASELTHTDQGGSDVGVVGNGVSEVSGGVHDNRIMENEVDASLMELSGYEGGDSTMDSSDCETDLNLKESSKVKGSVIDLCDSDENYAESGEIICQYPHNLPGSISVKMPDYETLFPGRFLNDTIIDFYRKFLHNEKLHPTYQQDVHIFPSQFYQRLIQTLQREA